MAKRQSVTSLGISPEEERRRRIIRYSVAMSIRVICLVLCVFVDGWWRILFFCGAVFLPYFAVVIANAPANGVRSRAASAVAPTLEIKAAEQRINE